MIKTYIFSQLGIIPGVPGEFGAGSIISVDEDTNTIVEAQEVHVLEEVEAEKPLREQKTQKTLGDTNKEL
jgi:hypothetical protein